MRWSVIFPFRFYRSIDVVPVEAQGGLGARASQPGWPIAVAYKSGYQLFSYRFPEKFFESAGVAVSAPAQSYRLRDSEIGYNDSNVLTGVELDARNPDTVRR